MTIRFRVRTLILAVALCGLVFGVAGWMQRRRVYFEGVANEHLQHRIRLVFEYDRVVANQHIRGESATNGIRTSARWMDAMRFHDAMNAKYLRAAKQPWWPVPADPPEPPMP